MRRENLEREGLGGKGHQGSQTESGSTRLHKPAFVHPLDKDTISFFFTDFPEEVESMKLWKLFARFGHVGEVYIPNKVDRWGRKFGFVKFKGVSDVVGMERKLANVTMGGSKLKVNLARFGREAAVPAAETVKVAKPTVAPARVVDGRSYSLATKSGSGSEIQAVAEQVQLEVLPSEMVLEELSRAFVGFLRFPMLAKNLQTSLFMDGKKGFKVTEMGDGMVLINCEEVGGVDRARKEDPKWWEGMFSEVRPWSPELVARRRSVWLKIVGIPLHVWDDNFFKLLGNKFDTFLYYPLL